MQARHCFPAALIFALMLLSLPQAAGEEDKSGEISDAALLELVREKRPDIYKRMAEMRESDPEKYARRMEWLRARYQQSRESGDASEKPDGKFRRKGPEGSPAGAPHHPPGITADIRAEVEKSMEETNRLRQEVGELTRKLANTEDEAERDALEKEIRSIVEKAFDLTTARREMIITAGEKRLAEAEQRLNKARESLESRKAKREEYINSFLGNIHARDTGSTKEADDKDGQTEEGDN